MVPCNGPGCYVRCHDVEEMIRVWHWHIFLNKDGKKVMPYHVHSYCSTNCLSNDTGKRVMGATR